LVVCGGREGPLGEQDPCFGSLSLLLFYQAG